MNLILDRSLRTFYLHNMSNLDISLEDINVLTSFKLLLNDQADLLDNLVNRSVLPLGQPLMDFPHVRFLFRFEVESPPGKFFHERLLRGGVLHSPKGDDSLQGIKASRPFWDLIAAALHDVFHPRSVLVHSNVMERHISLVCGSFFHFLCKRGEFLRVKAPLCVISRAKDS